MRMWRAILLISLLGLASAFEDKTIPQYLADNGFTTLASTVTALGLDTALSGVGKSQLDFMEILFGINRIC